MPPSWSISREKPSARLDPDLARTRARNLGYGATVFSPRRLPLAQRPRQESSYRQP